MEFALFSDLIDALGKVVSGLKAVANLSKNERDKYRQVMDETYRLIDTTLNMVIIRLGDILICDDNDFMQEVMRLNNYGDWVQAEREFRLCKSLRTAVRETETLRSQLTGVISTNDWDSLLGQMHAVLTTEQEVANFIGQQFSSLVDSIQASLPVPQTPAEVRTKITQFREALIKERRQLIQQEMVLYAIV